MKNVYFYYYVKFFVLELRYSRMSEFLSLTTLLLGRGFSSLSDLKSDQIITMITSENGNAAMISKFCIACAIRVNHNFANSAMIIPSLPYK